MKYYYTDPNVSLSMISSVGERLFLPHYFGKSFGKRHRNFYNTPLEKKSHGITQENMTDLRNMGNRHLEKRFQSSIPSKFT